MRITAVIVFILSMQVYAKSFGQVDKINLKMNSSFKEVIEQLEKISGYRFVLKYDQGILNKVVDINYTNEKIDKVLNDLLKDTGFTYKVIDRYVAIVPISEAIDILQQKPVSGNVTDSTGSPLPGVSVVVKGTTTGVITDADGNFSLPNVPENATLQFSFVGMKALEVAVSGKTTVNVKMEDETVGIEEVVAVGYGTLKKSDLTGAISSVGSKDLAKSTNINIQSAIQGRAPGVMASSQSGAPGSVASIRVRGIGTVNDNSPIYVVDGMIVSSSMNYLNPSDIESIEVLKDASAQAIYGSRGANGVILITTKMGSETKPVVTFNSTTGISRVARIVELLDANEFLDYVLTANYNGYMRTIPNADPNIDPRTLNNMTKMAVSQHEKGINTDWLGEVLQENVISQNHNFSIRGGSKLARYAASAGYNNEDGIIEKSNFKRYSFRLNTDYKIGKYVKIGENLGISSMQQLNSGGGFSGPIGAAMQIDPLTPILKPVGVVSEDHPDYNYNKYSGAVMNTAVNPLAKITITHNNISSLTIIGNIYAEVILFKDFKFRSSWGFNNGNSETSDFTPRFYVSPTDQNVNSIVSVDYSKRNGWILENIFSYNKTIKEHSINAMVGYTSEYTKFSNFSASKQGTLNNDEELRTFDAATILPNVSGGYNISTMISYLSRVNYSYKNRYLLTTSIRRDGSSSFGPGHKWGVFPSFSAGWRLLDEPFLSKLNLKPLNSLKLRAGWGQIGNSSLPVSNAYVSQIQSIADYKYAFNDKEVTGYYLKTIGTPDISWETTEQTNVGIDLGLFSNSLSISADYFIRKTNGMLLQVPFVAYAGYSSSAAPYTNAGSMQNNGYEVLATYNGRKGDFNYSVSVNGSILRNEVTSLGFGDKPIINLHNRTEVGSTIGRFYGWVTDGIFQTDAEVQSYMGPTGKVLQPNARAGDFRFKNLNNDDVIDSFDQTWIGNPLPKLSYGLSLSLTYKTFDFVALLQGLSGNDIYNATLSRLGTLAGEYNNSVRAYKDAWRGPGTSNTHPLMTTVDKNNNYRISDYFVENGSYLRLKDLQLGYNLSSSACKKLSIENARIWIGGTDIFTISNYSGNDPEVGFGSPTISAGTDNFAPYPKMSKYLIGINLSF